MALSLNSMTCFSSPKLPSKTLSLRSPAVYMASTLHTTSKEAENLKKSYCPPREVHIQKVEIFKSLEGWAEQNVLVHFKPVDKCWQPQDFLPDPESEGFYEQVKELMEKSKEFLMTICRVGWRYDHRRSPSNLPDNA